MNSKSIFMFLFCFGLLSSLVAETTATLTVGTNAEFAPFTFREKGEIVGFEIDIAKEVCKRLNKEIKFKDMPFDALIPDIIMGHVDFVAAGMTSTPERAKRVAFTEPYFNGDPLVILTLAKPGTFEITHIEDLKDKNVAVNEGYTADLYLSSKPGIGLVRLQTAADAFLALSSGRVEAFVTAKSTMDMFMRTQDARKYSWIPIEGTSENCALVVSKKHPKMLQEIQKVLDGMDEDGTLTQLKSKWKLL